MNDFNRTDDDLRDLFRPHREATVASTTESDLAAARSRSIAGQRGRVLGGTAAVAILAVGGGALAFTGGATDSPDIVRSAQVADDAAATAPIADRVSATPSEQAGQSDVPAANDDAIDEWLAEFPAPPMFDAADFPTLGESAPGEQLPRFHVEFDKFFEGQRVAIQEWSGELADWFGDRPDGEIVIGADRLLEAGMLGDLLGDDITEIDPAFDAEFEKLEDVEVTITDDSIEIDLDGDGAADEVLGLSDVQDGLREIGELDVSELGLDELLDDIDLSEFDVDELLDKVEIELDGLDLEGFDLDQLLEDFDLGDIDWESGELPDLSELDLPDGVELPTEAEIDELLQDLETELDGLDLGDFEFDTDDIGQLLDLEKLEDLFGS